MFVFYNSIDNNLVIRLILKFIEFSILKSSLSKFYNGNILFLMDFCIELYNLRSLFYVIYYMLTDVSNVVKKIYCISTRTVVLVLVL